MRIFYSLIIAAFIVFIALMITHATQDTKKKKEAAVENAIRAGRTATAILTRSRATRKSIPGTHEFWSSIGYYQYEYKGKTYKYKYWSDNPPSTLKLYWVKHPSKATVGGSLSPVEVNWFLVYLVAASAVYWRMGM